MSALISHHPQAFATLAEAVLDLLILGLLIHATWPTKE